MESPVEMVMVETKPNHPTTPKALIPLGHNRFAIVDPKWLDYLNQWSWFAKWSFNCIYAVRTERINAKKIFIRMHRVIAHTPEDEVCHHGNLNSLDNRSDNLENMSWFDHTKLHSHR